MIGHSANHESTDQNEEVRERILAAAEQRFQQYGYGKTTMAEIAKDCGMSAANIYRFFENKLDIAKILTRRWLAKKEARLRAVATREDRLPPQRLETFVIEKLRFTYQLWSEHPRINELVDSILVECPSVLDQHTEALAGVLTALLIEGQGAGIFERTDPAETAETILMTTKLFAMPSCMGMRSLDEFERLGRNAVQLILRGLERR